MRGSNADLLATLAAARTPNRMGKSVKAANLNHALRRTCGRTAWAHGVPIETISYMLGHEDTTSTRRYLALNLEDVRSVISVLNEVFPSAVGA